MPKWHGVAEARCREVADMPKFSGFTGEGPHFPAGIRFAKSMVYVGVCDVTGPADWPDFSG